MKIAYNSKIAYNCRKRKRNNLISKTYTATGIVHLTSDNMKNGKPLKVLHMILITNMSLDFEIDVRNNYSWVWVCFDYLFLY